MFVAVLGAAAMILTVLPLFWGVDWCSFWVWSCLLKLGRFVAVMRAAAKVWTVLPLCLGGVFSVR